VDQLQIQTGVVLFSCRPGPAFIQFDVGAFFYVAAGTLRAR
jgi:hypothetical protein